jgi:hypothetical protein
LYICKLQQIINELWLTVAATAVAVAGGALHAVRLCVDVMCNEQEDISVIRGLEVSL